jgi:transcriptional regulator with PAS, ATPase and Fis domain
MHLPSGSLQQPGFENEREILYKILFDLKAEFNDLKQLVFSLIKDSDKTEFLREPYEPLHTPGLGPFTKHNPDQEQFVRPRHEIPLLEESLYIERKEKDLITKALRKHQNNRKKASGELGISERTLYRKIRQYGLDA